MKFGVEDKTFGGDLAVIAEALKNRTKFSFSKYADGEFEILVNRKITNIDNWTFDPEQHKEQHDALMASFKYNEEGYYIGISCACCVGQHNHNWMKNTVTIPNENLTWANIFVNANYPYFAEHVLPEFKNYDVILVANENAQVNKLPFKVEEHIKIGGTAFIENFDLLESLPKGEYKDKLFLFCAGPLGNMLAHKMWEANKENTYIDIGSTLNVELLGQKNRGYLRGGPTLKKVCTWK